MGKLFFVRFGMIFEELVDARFGGFQQGKKITNASITLSALRAEECLEKFRCYLFDKWNFSKKCAYYFLPTGNSTDYLSSEKCR